MPTGSRTRAWVVRGVRLFFTVGVTWLIVDRLGVGLDDALSVGAALPEPSEPLIAASVLVLLLGFAFSAWLWGRMVFELGGPRALGLAASARIVFSANLGRYLPGKVWQIAGLAALARREGVGVAVATTAGVLGQAFSLAAAGVLASPMLFGGEALGGGRALLIALMGLAILASVPGALRRGLEFGFGLARVESADTTRVRGLFGLRWLVLYLSVWIIYGSAFVMLIRGMGLGGEALGLASAFAAAYLMGYVAIFAPAGLGVREGFLIAFLQPQMGGAAAAVAILARVWMTSVELVPAGAFALWEVMRSPSAGPPTGSVPG